MNELNEFAIYVRSLQANLKGASRRDIAREVMADLQAELEAARVAHPSMDAAALMRDIVARRETPEELAAKLQPRPDALIGGRIYPFYRLSLGLALSITVVTLIPILLSFQLLENSATVWMVVRQVGLSAIIVFFLVTAVFALVERSRLARRMSDQPAPVLPALRRRTGDGGSSDIPSLFFAIVVLTLLNMFPYQVGLPMVLSEPSFQVRIFPVLSDYVLGTPRLLIDLWCAAVLAVGLSPRLGVATAWIKGLRVILRVLGVAVGAGILLGGPVFALPTDTQLGVLPADLAAAMTDVIAPNLFKTLLVVFWVGLVMRAGYCIADLMKAYRAHAPL